MATVLYTGPIGKAPGGADISYGVSGIVAGVICYVWGGWLKRPQQTAAARKAVSSTAQRSPG